MSFCFLEESIFPSLFQGRSTPCSSVRTSNFEAEAERLCILLRFEAENVLRCSYIIWFTLFQ